MSPPPPPNRRRLPVPEHARRPLTWAALAALAVTPLPLGALEPPAVLPRPAQDPTEEARIRTLAAELAASTEDAAGIWARTAGVGPRSELLRAAARAWRGDARLAELARMGLAEGFPDALAAAAAAAASRALDEEVASALAAAGQSPSGELLRLAWSRGVLPADGAPTGQQTAYRRAAAAALSEGILPQRRLAACATALTEPATLLLPLSGRLLPDGEVAAFLRLDRSAWNAGAAELVELLLLDHRAHPDPAQARGALWRRFRGPAQTGAAAVLDAALAAGFRRHAIELEPGQLGAVDLVAEAEGRGGAWILDEAPARLASPLLAALAHDADAPSELRRRAALRLLRCDGEAWAEDFLGLLRPGVPDDLAEALLVVLDAFVPAALTEQVLAQPPFGGRAAAADLELRLRGGSPESRAVQLRRVLELPAPSRLRAARAAWEAGPSPELVQVFRSWSRHPAPEVQDLARRILSEALSEQEVADHYAALLDTAGSTAESEAALTALRALRTDAALQVYIRWLDSPEGRRHPESGARAAMVVPEAAARGLFLRWWGEPDGLRPDQLDAAAAALVATHRDARDRLYARLPQLPRAMQMPLLDRLREGALDEDHAFWRDAFLGRETNSHLRRGYAIGLAKSLPDTLGVVDECLALLAGRARMGAMPEGPWTEFAEAVLVYDSPEDRARHLVVLRAAEEDLSPAGRGLRIARLRGMVRGPLPEELSPLVAETVSMLAGLPEWTAPRPPLVPQQVQQSLPELTFALMGVAAHGEAGDAALAEALSTATSGAGACWRPEALWLIAETSADRTPASGAAAREWLQRLEPAGSPYLEAAAVGAELAPWTWTDRSRLVPWLQEALAGDRLPRGAEEALRRAQERWPEDRRVWDLGGWFAIARGDLDTAAECFERSRKRSGRTEQTQREPLLGLAVVAELRDPGSEALARRLEADPDGAILLPHRLPTGLSPELSTLLPAVAETSD